MVFVFFFSSRRRHTRFDCDWSSDVCSSDLKAFLCRIGGAQCASRHPQPPRIEVVARSEEHTSELQSQSNLVCRLLLEKKNDDTDPQPEQNTLQPQQAYQLTLREFSPDRDCV